MIRKLLKVYFLGIFLGLALLPLEIVLIKSSSLPVKAEDLGDELRDSVRFEADQLRDEIRDMPCEDGSQETCGRPTPSRPPHRDPCIGDECRSPEPSYQPSPEPSIPPGVSPSPGNGGNSGTGGNGDNGDDGGNGGDDGGDNGGGGSVSGVGVQGQILGLSYTGS